MLRDVLDCVLHKWFPRGCERPPRTRSLEDKLGNFFEVFRLCNIRKLLIPVDLLYQGSDSCWKPNETVSKAFGGPFLKLTGIQRAVFPDSDQLMH